MYEHFTVHIKMLKQRTSIFTNKIFQFETFLDQNWACFSGEQEEDQLLEDSLSSEEEEEGPDIKAEVLKTPDEDHHPFGKKKKKKKKKKLETGLLREIMKFK